ncbi:MAG TPA: EAL domain-containing protein [Allosphingosinicella sp.]|jgi:diguanylate cyclase (GGDEF)-like protein/PAS domain S-box-containing protein
MLHADPRKMRPGAEPRDDAAALHAALAETEAQLREAKRQFEQFAANLNGVAYRRQLEEPRRLTFLSEGIEALTGHGPEGMGDAKAWAAIVHRDDLAAVEAEIAAAVAERRSFSLCYRVRHASGDWRWVREQGRAARTEDGPPLFLEGVVTDAGPEKQLELSLRAAEAEASRRAESLHTLLDAVPQMIWSYDVERNRPRFSRQWETFTGLDLNAPGAPTRLHFIHPDDRDEADERWRRCRETGESYEAQYRIRHKSGEYRWILSRGHPHRGPDGQIRAWYGSCTDIHERMIAEAALDASERLAQGIIEASPDCMSVLGLDGRRLFANAATRRAYQVDEETVLDGELWGTRFPEPARTQAAEALALAQTGELARLLIQYGPEQRWWDIILAPVRDEQDRPTSIIVLSRDITDQKKAEERASWAANHDALTGLPNRFLFQKTLDEAIACVHVGGGGFAILLLDVDDFKRINDTLGHDAGDSLLCTFAERIRGALRTEDMVARLGGDEFAVLLAGVEEESGVAAAVESILAALREPCVHAGRVLDCQASIGASLFPHQGSDRAELLKNADVALYAAKAAGRANLKLFRADMRQEMQSRLSMLNLARDALAHRWIVPFYQPKIDLQTGRAAGFEALLRWQHPSLGAQSPSTIAAAFEDLALATEISDQMIGAVIADLVGWRDRGVDIGHVAINAAAAEFRRGDFADKLLERMHAAGLPPRLLQVEVTETVFLGRGAECVERALKLLSGAGVGIALDDFGTGYASLSHLKQFPVDLIKIDRSFIRDLEEDPDDAAIVDAVVNLGRALGIGTVAEGVETDRQHAFLVSLGCDFGQGFLYGRAAPADEVAGMLRMPASPLRRVG